MKSVLKISMSIVTSFVLLTGLTSWVGTKWTSNWYYNGTISEDFFDAGNWSTTNLGGACGQDEARPCHLPIEGSTEEDLQDVLDSYDNTNALLAAAGRRAN